MSDDLDDGVTDSANPLLRPLERVELDLLEAIWDPISKGTAPWPVWDYVSRTLYRGSLEVHDAAVVFRALPTVPEPPRPEDLQRFATPYGLVWRSGEGPDMSDQERVGLTIAGLVQLAHRRPELTAFANRLATVIAHLADAERAVDPDPMRCVRAEVSFTEIISGAVTPTADFRTQVPEQVVIDLLEHEYADICFLEGLGDTGLVVSARPFFELKSAQDYLERIGLMSQRQQRPAPVRRGEELAQTLDYVSYVLAAHAAWKSTGRLVVVCDLETVATLAANVVNQMEFSHRLSALATVLDDLQTPAPSLEAEDGWRKQVGAGANDRPRSLARLEIWLQTTLEDEARRDRALEAVKDLKGVKDLRNLGQHSGTGLRRKAKRACSRLGIDEPIRDWPGAWEIVRARVADAFDIIRQEVSPRRDVQEIEGDAQVGVVGVRDIGCPRV